MLKRNILESVRASAHLFPNLTAVSSTPLARLVASSCDLSGHKFEYDNAIDVLEDLANDKSGGEVYNHTANFDSVKALYLDSVRASVKTANSIVLPAIRSLADAVANEQSLVQERTFDLIKVRVVAADPLFLMPELDTLIPEAFVERPTFPTDANLVFDYIAGLDLEEQKRLAETGVGSVDAIMPERVKRINFDTVREAFRSDYRTDAENTLLNTDIIAYIFMLNGMLNGNLGTISNEMKLAVYDVRACLVGNYRRLVRRMLSDLSDRLVWGISDDHVMVEARAYKKYIAAGGSMEALMAYGSEPRNKFRSQGTKTEELLERNGELVQSYSRKVNTERVIKDLDATATVEATVRKTIAELALSTPTAMSPIEIAKWFDGNPYSKSIELDEYLVNCALDVLRFEGTQVGTFIRTKRSVAKSLEGADATAADVTTAAILTMIAKSLATQILSVEPDDGHSSASVSLSDYYKDV